LSQCVASARERSTAAAVDSGAAARRPLRSGRNGEQKRRCAGFRGNPMYKVVCDCVCGGWGNYTLYVVAFSKSCS
jgi:hypothetical protein